MELSLGEESDGEKITPQLLFEEFVGMCPVMPQLRRCLELWSRNTGALSVIAGSIQARVNPCVCPPKN